MAEETVTYWLDGENRVARVAGGWDAFARGNDAAQLAGDAAVGLPMREFVSGDAARMLMDAILGYVRSMRHGVVRCYRCDSPDVRRWLEMTVTPEPHGLVRLDHRELRTEARVRRIATPIGNPPIVTRCTLCCRVLDDGRWVEVEEFRGGNLDVIPVAYGVCPDCATGSWLPAR